VLLRTHLQPNVSNVSGITAEALRMGVLRNGGEGMVLGGSELFPSSIAPD